MSRKLQADLLLAGCSLVWGATFVVVKLALSDASVFVFLSLRFLLAGLVLAFMERGHWRGVKAGLLRAGVLLGCLLFAGFAFQTVGLTRTTPSKSAFITGIFVVLVPLFLAVFGRKTVARSVWLGVFTAVAGLYFLTVPHSGLANLNLGDVLTFGCAVIYAVHIIAIGHYAPRYSTGMLVFLQVTLTGLLSVVAVLVLFLGGWEAPRLAWTPGLFWAVLATGLLATVGTISVQVWVQRNTDSSHVALLFTLEPVFAGLTSYLFMGERLGPRSLAGAALILSGILIAELTGGTGEVS
jgi:drug/metabolite transporter (DMT)-like permease